MRRPLLLLAVFASLSFRTTLAGDAPPGRPPDSVRIALDIDAPTLVTIQADAMRRFWPNWSGGFSEVRRGGMYYYGCMPVFSGPPGPPTRDTPFQFVVLPTDERPWTHARLEIAGPVYLGTGPVGGRPIDDDAVAIERFEWRKDSEFGSVAATDPKVYDGRVPRWFLAHVPRGKSVSLPIALPGPGPVMDATVTIDVQIFATHEGPVTLGGRWANLDLGDQTASTAAGGATLTFTCPAKDVPPPNGPLVFTDRTKDLPATGTDDVSEGRGTIWIDSVTLESPMLPHKGPRITVQGHHPRLREPIRARLAEVDASGLLKPHWNPPDPVAAAKDADEVILSTAVLMPSAKRLADHRSKSGTRTVVVPIADVWDKMRGGEPDSEAVREYLAALAKDGHGPKFVLLCGDAALDRTDIVDWESIPTLYARTKYNGATASDRMFVLPSPDAKTGGPSIGRLPFRDPKDLENYVDRVIRYETAPPADPTRRLLRFVTSEGRFGPQIDSLIEGLFTRIVATKIPAAYDCEVTFASVGSQYCWPPPQFNERVLFGLNEGALFYTYIGHGYAQGFDSLHDGDQRYPILRSADAPQVDVKGTPPVLFVVACTTAMFDDPKRDSVGETLLKRPNGPLAYWGATRICHPVWNSMVGRELAVRLFEDPTRRLGEVISTAVDRAVVPDPTDLERKNIEMMTKALVPPGTDFDRIYVEGSRMYELLGDPAIKIAYPKDDLAVAVERTDKGFTLHVTGPLPDGADVSASVEVPRNKNVETLKVEKTPADPSGYESMKARYARANDKAVARGSAKAAGGAATITLEVPEAQRGWTLTAKAWSIAGGDVHQGSSPVPPK